MRENRYKPDYHAGAIETAQMYAFFPEKVRCDVAKTLKPQDDFHWLIVGTRLVLIWNSMWKNSP